MVGFKSKRFDLMSHPEIKLLSREKKRWQLRWSLNKLFKYVDLMYVCHFFLG